MSGESNEPEGDGWEPAQVIDPERDQQIAELKSADAGLNAVVQALREEGQALREEGERQNRTIEELSKVAFQLMMENARLNSGRMKNGRAPDMATECFSTIGETLLRRGTTKAELEEILQMSFRRLRVPRPNDRVKDTIAWSIQRLAEQP